ncbi:MAG TPA: alpha/beta hydrolase [Streptosporangiaceae bacterium]|nr:alpha/beta hydrolase [Streptosporangiaceae bacterium]
MNRTARSVIVAAAPAAGFAALAANPAVRREARRIGRFARPLRRAETRPPVPPCLPPGRVITLPGRGEVFVRDSGGSPAAPAVLLLHGWTASADLNFFPVYAPLARSYRVIAPDLRGHGRGMRSAEPFRLEDCADDAAALLDELGVQHVIAVGYSMGGPVGLLLARRHPGRVEALVMQATALEWRHKARERVVWRLLSVLELSLRLGTGAGFVERVLRQAIEDAPELDVYRAWLAAEFRRGLAREMGDAGRALSRYDARPWASRLGLPAVMLITTRDRLVRPAKQRALAEALRAQVIEVDADHDLPLVRSDEYARLTRLAVDTAAAAAGLEDPAGSAGGARGPRDPPAARLKARRFGRRRGSRPPAGSADAAG